MVKTGLVAGYTLLLVLIFSAVCFSQMSDQETISAFTGAQLYSRTLESEAEKSVKQWALPVFISAMAAENINLRFYQAYSTAKLEDDPSLSGLENTRLRGSISLLENRLVTYLGMGLPISSVTPEEETVELSELLYSEALQFGVSKYTEGFGLNGGLAFIQPFGKLSMGIGAAYLMRGSYDKLSNSNELISYNPGDIFTNTIGLNFYDGMTRIQTGISYLYYGDDTIDDGDAFQNGNEMTFSVIVAFEADPLVISFVLADTIKGDSEAVQERAEISNLFTNRLNIGMNLGYSLLNDIFILKARTNIKQLSYDGDTGSRAISFGGGFHLAINDNVALEIMGDYISGNIDTGETDFSGYDLSSIVKFSF